MLYAFVTLKRLGYFRQVPHFNAFPYPGCALRLRVTFGLSAPSSAPRGGLAVTSYFVDPCSRSVCTSPSRGEGVRRSPAKHGPIPVRSGILHVPSTVEQVEVSRHGARDAPCRLRAS